MSSFLAACFVLAAGLYAVLGSRVEEHSSLQEDKEGVVTQPDDGPTPMEVDSEQTDHSKGDQQMEEDDAPFPCCKEPECCQNEGNRGYKGLQCAKASFWTGKFPQCEKLMVDGRHKPPETHVIKFLRNKSPDYWGRMLATIQGWSNQELQTNHNWLAWIFPTDKPSPLSPNAAPLSDIDIKLIKKEGDLQQAIRNNFERFARFLGMKVEWKTGQVSISDGDDHEDREDNFWDRDIMTVTEAIHHVKHSLRLLGLETEAQQFEEQVKVVEERNDFAD